MGIIDRLGDVLRSYLHGEDEPSSYGPARPGYGDPDLDAAYEELNDFLGGAAGSGRSGSTGRSENNGAGGFRSAGQGFAGKVPSVPESLKGDFAELGLPPGSSPGDCKSAYKRLLKLHHPDRHAGHKENMRKATEKSARINAAYDRIRRWQETGSL